MNDWLFILFALIWLFNVSLTFNVELMLICVLFCSEIFWILFVLSFYTKQDFWLTIWCRLFIARFLLGPDVRTGLVGRLKGYFCDQIWLRATFANICLYVFLHLFRFHFLTICFSAYIINICQYFGVFKVFKTYDFAYLKSFWSTLLTRI